MNRVWLTLKPGLASLVNLALVLSISQPLLAFPLSAQAATTIFSDSFGSSPSNTVTGWIDSDVGASDAAIKTNPDNRPGSATTGYVQLKKKTSYIATTSVSTIGLENISLEFYWRGAGDADGGELLVVEWKKSSDSNYATSTTLDLTDETWGQENLSLPSSADDTTIDIRFRIQTNANDEAALIDDVSLVGDAVNNNEEEQEEEEEEEEPQETDYAVYGLKYNDANANGTRDNGEEGLGGVTMKLYQDGDVASTTVTSWDGNFGFNNLELGEEYLICEELPAGWHQTDPTEDGGSTWRAEGRKKCKNDTWGYEVEISEPEAYSFEFGNVKGGLIMGIKYRDNNNNGERDEEESNLADWTIRLYDSEGEEVAETKTTWDGYFTFDGLEPGTYTVCEVIPDNDDNWRQTDPTEEGGSSWRAEGRVFCETEDTWGYNFEIGWGDEEYSFIFGNVPGAILAGWKYNDANANGQRDGAFPTEEDGERGITNHPIKLYKIDDENESEWEEVATTYTDPDLWAKGMFYFKGLEPGDYYMCEEMPALGEWLQTDPREDGGSTWRAEGRIECPNGTWGYVIDDLDWGDEEYSYSFGNHKYAAVRVTKIAVPDTGTFNFTLEGTDNDYEKTLSTFGSTEVGEPLEFLKLLPGAYKLSEALPEGWDGVQTSECTDGVNSVDPGSITLTSGLEVNCTFNNSEYGVISGYKFEDREANGTRTNPTDEPGLSGWTIKLYQAGEGGLTEVGSTATDETGFYAFSKLGAGTYYVCEESQGGWTQSTPTSGYACENGTLGYEVEIEAGEINAGSDFGNWRAGGITGYKWHDLNHDGIKDEDEPKLSDWVIFIDKNGNDILDGDETNTTTDENGEYSFSGLNAGMAYELREVAQGGWVQTYPAGDGAQTVVVLSGQDVSANFGNHEGEIPVPDTEAPNTIITSPNPETEWFDKIWITGTTTDNVAVATTTLSFAIWDGEDCGSYSEIVDLGNPALNAIFDWMYEWTPGVEGDFCIQANGTDTSGNEEHTATVFPIKFKKTATTTPPIEEEENGGGGGSGNDDGPTKKLTDNGDDNNGGTGGGDGTTDDDNVTNPNPNANNLLGLGGNAGVAGGVAPLALLTGDDEGGTTTELGAGTSTATTTDNSNLLAAIGGLDWLGEWWFWLLLILVILAIIGGYYYWRRRQENY